ncbi:MAG: VirB4 family type IV secretion system protein [Bacillota bacterium]
MIFRKKKQSKSAQPQETTGKKQPDYFTGAGTVQDFLAPAMIKEVKPGEQTLGAKASKYWVEIGSTIEPVRYVRSFVAVLKGDSTWAGMLDQLYAGEFGQGDCDIAIHIKPADISKILSSIQRKISGLESDIITEANSSKRAEMLNELADLQSRQARLRTSGEKAFFATIQAVASGTKLEPFLRFCNAMVTRFAGLNVYLRGADTRQLEAMMAASPIDRGGVMDDFSSNMESSNLADLFPFGQGSISHKSGIVLGVDPQDRLVFYDCWHPGLDNYNMVILGQSGSGKSVAIKTMTVKSALLGIHSIIIDQEGEYGFIEKLGCPYIRLSPHDKHRINIFDVEIDTDDQTGQRFVNLDENIAAVKAVVFRIIRQVDSNLLIGSIKIKIEELIRKLYTNFGITEDPDSLYTNTGGGFKLTKEVKPMPTLSDLYHLMTTDLELKVVTQIVKVFTREGGSKSQAIFDGQSTITIGDYPILGFSLKELDKEIMKPLGTFIVTRWVWERFGKKDRRQKKRIVTEEAQVMMSNPEEAIWMENAFRRSRKLNISMCAVTQGFEVFTRVPEGIGILKNAPTKLLLRQEPLDIDAVQGKLNLSDGEAQFLLMSGKGQAILRVDREATIIQIDLTQKEYEMFTTNPNDPVSPKEGVA